MKFQYEIPQGFWGLFRSVNREIYIEALLVLNDEYQYSNYFLTREACLQVLSDMCSVGSYTFEREESEDEESLSMSLPRRILNWLIRAGWLRKVEDYNTMTTNIVIPDYAAVMIEAFERYVNEPQEDTQIYIQNVYATLFSFRSDSRMNIGMLQTALINTRKLNKALQDMLHNMDKFFDKLIHARTYGELLKEHLEGYVEEVVRKKYHILKTSDNFYIYKMDIKRCLKEMREDEEWLSKVRQSNMRLYGQEGDALDGREECTERKPSTASGGESSHGESYFRRHRSTDVLDLIDQIERGFETIEHRIANMDKEHSKYVRATVSRLNYLLREDDDRKGLLVQLLHKLGSGEEELSRKRLALTAESFQLSGFDILHDSPLYKRRSPRKFEELVEEMDKQDELSREDVLKLNQIQHRFTRQQIEEFVESHLEEGIFAAKNLTCIDDETFEKLILAYDLGMRKNSRFQVRLSGKQVHNGSYSYPEMIFAEREWAEKTGINGISGINGINGINGIKERNEG